MTAIPEAPPAGSQPAPRKRVRPLAWLVIVLIVAVGAGWFVRTTVFTPQALAQRYLDALEAGDATTAMGILRAASSAGSGLLQDDVFAQATDRITNTSTGAVTVSGDDATVDVFYWQDSRQQRTQLQLTRQGTDWLVFDKWAIANVAPGRVSFTVPPALDLSTLLVNGVPVDLSSDGALALAAFPGTYTLATPGSTFFEPTSQTTTVAGLTDEDALNDSSPVLLEARPTAQYKDAAIAAVQDAITECLAAPPAAGDSCPKTTGLGDVGVPSSTPKTARFRYSLAAAPVLTTLMNDDGTLGVMSASPGSISGTLETSDNTVLPAELAAAREWGFTVQARVGVVKGAVAVLEFRGAALLE